MKDNIIKNILDFILITIGALLAAIALDTILVPNQILDGGITGISIIISQLSKVPLGILVAILNIPFIYIGYRHLGKQFLIKGIYSMVMFSILLTSFHNIEPIIEDMLLATVFGGLLLGIGVGLVLRFGGCLDGTESVAMVLSRKTSLSTGQVILIFNLFIYGVAGIIFGFDRALYSLLTYFITFKIIDVVSEGLEQAKAAFIITDEAGEIADQIYHRLGRTVTIIEGKGLISGEKAVLYSVITRIEIPEFKQIIKEHNHSTFVTLTDVSEIIGNHIKSSNEDIQKQYY